MATTKQWDRRENVLHTRTDVRTGEIVYNETLKRGEVDTATADWSRPRPFPLTSTKIQLYKQNDHYGGWYITCYRNPSLKTGTRQYARLGAVVSYPAVIINGNIALTKARAKMEERGFGEALAELNQTTSMIVKRMTDLVRFMRAVRSGRWDQLRKPSEKLRKTPGSKRLANNMLELQYGWLPVINDVYDILDAFSSGIARRGTKISSRSSHTVLQGDTPVTARAGFTGVVSNEAAFNLNQWGLLNPVNLAWNLLPLSFVVDWFVPISRTLGALTGTAGLSVVDTWYIDVHSLRSRGYDQNCTASDWWLHSTWKSISRWPGSFIFVPSLYARQGALNAGKVATAAALIRQRAF